MPLSSMRDALRLTRQGRLAEATALLRGADATPQPGVLAGLLGRVTGRAEPVANARPAAPKGGDQAMTARTFSSAAGSRDYRLFVPAGATGPRPLLVMLHGCTQTAEDFAAGTAMNACAEAEGVIVAWPEQPRRANPNTCWNWFNPADQSAGAGEPALIAGIAAEVTRNHAVDPGRVFVAGLSAGGAAAALMARAYPDVFTAVGIHSGLAAGAAHDLNSALAAMKQGAAGHGGITLPMIVFHGDADRTVSPANATEVLAQAMQPGLRRLQEEAQVAGGRAYTRTQYRDTSGAVRLEDWSVHGAGHAWSGGTSAGSYTDPTGPDASAAILGFFLAQPG